MLLRRVPQCALVVREAKHWWGERLSSRASWSSPYWPPSWDVSKWQSCRQLGMTVGVAVTLSFIKKTKRNQTTKSHPPMCQCLLQPRLGHKDKFWAGRGLQDFDSTPASIWWLPWCHHTAQVHSLKYWVLKSIEQPCSCHGDFHLLLLMWASVCCKYPRPQMAQCVHVWNIGYAHCVFKCSCMQKHMCTSHIHLCIH